LKHVFSKVDADDRLLGHGKPRQHILSTSAELTGS
jgi:hypothetical protein